MLKQLFDHILCVLRRKEMLFRLFDSTVEVCNGDVVPPTHIDFFYIGIVEIMRQYRILRHFRIQSFCKRLFGIAVHRKPGVIEVLRDIRFEFRHLGAVNECRRILS